MPDETSTNVLYRMAGIEAGPDGAGADDPSPGLDRAMAEAVARVSAAIPGLPLAVKSYQTERKIREVALAATPTPGTILPLTSPNAEFGGAVILDPSLTDALVEVQTLGRVERVARTPRMPTRIDAALCRGFAAKVLRDAAGKPGVPTLSDPHPNRHLNLSSQLELEVTVPSLILVELALCFADSERTGLLTLMLPDRPRTALPVPTDSKRGSCKPERRADPAKTLRAAKARLEATLPSVTLTLGDLLALKVGDTIALPPKALSTLTLSGKRLGMGRPQRPSDAVIFGRLGQQDGRRAIKINVQPDPAAVQGTDASGAQAAASDEIGVATLPAPNGGGFGQLPQSAPPPVSKNDQSGAGTSDLPALESPSAASAAQQLDETGNASTGLPDLPDLPDLGDLSDLPDLPDLPDLDVSNG